MRQPRAVTDKRYEEKHKEERKAKSLVWGTSVPRQFAEEINEFLSQYGYTKVQLIEAGYKALLDEAAENDLGLAKIMDGYDDFFESEKKQRSLISFFLMSENDTFLMSDNAVSITERQTRLSYKEDNNTTIQLHNFLWRYGILRYRKDNRNRKGNNQQ